jgi:SAM-dependent methyltransferase
MRIIRIVKNMFVRFFDKVLKRSHSLQERLQYLENECSELRQIVRFLQADSKAWQSYMVQTRTSFDTQWELLPEGDFLLTDNSFKNSMINLLESYTKLPRSWFQNKNILDAGCGNGRWSYALSSIGANVTAIDQSAHGIKSVETLCKEFSNFKALQLNLLEPLPFKDGTFDMVWSFGVLHHTGNTFQAFQHVAPLVKSGGTIFLMLYGEPSKEKEYTEINDYVFHRRQISGMNFKEKIDYCKKQFEPNLVHGWFDAISPSVNDLYRFDEIRDWLLMAGYTNVQRTFENRNLFITATRK